MSGTHIDYAKYMFMALIICTLCSLLFLLVGKYVFRPDVSKLANLNADKLDKDQSLTLSGVQKLVLAFLFALVALLLIPAFLPEDLLIVRFLKSIGNTGICAKFTFNCLLTAQHISHLIIALIITLSCYKINFFLTI